MSCPDYWRESALEMLSEIGAYNLLTGDQISEFSRGIESIANLEYEATGQQCIPDPRDTEIEELKRKYAQSEKDKANIIGCFSHVVGQTVYFDENSKEVRVV